MTTRMCTSLQGPRSLTRFDRGYRRNDISNIQAVVGAMPACVSHVFTA